MTCLQNIRLHGKYLRLISNQHQEQLTNIIRENRLSSHTHLLKEDYERVGCCPRAFFNLCTEEILKHVVKITGLNING